MPGTTVITAAQLDLLKTTLVARWNRGLAASNPDWNRVAKPIGSSSRSNSYQWLSQFPAFREWVGARQHKRLAEIGYEVVNKKFETTIDVPRTDIEDDNLGQYGTLAESAGQSAKDLMNDLVFQAIAEGFSTTCYDGQYFFDTDHPVYANEDGSGEASAVSNFQEGTGAPWVLLCTKRAASALYLQERIKPQFESQTTVASQQVYDLDVYSFGGRWRGAAAYGFWQCAFGSKAELTPENFDAAYDAMMAVKGDGHRKLGIVADLMVVGPANRAAAERVLLADRLANGATNTNYKKVDLLVTPWM